MAIQLVIEWTRATVRLAMVEQRRSQFQFLALRSEPTGPGGDPQPALRALLKAIKLGTAQVIGVLPREQVITRVVKFPTMQAEELGQMVELYAKAQLPYPREQIVVDFHVVQQREGFSTVAVVACQREVVERSLTVLRDAGLSVELLTVSSWGVLGWHQRIAPRTGAAATGAAVEPVVVINVDDTRTDLVVIAGGRILSSRGVGQGAQDWEAAADATEVLVQEVERSRTALRKELPDAEIRSLLVTGLGTLGQWAESLTQRLGLPVNVVESRQPLMERPMPTTAAISPVVIGGIACRVGRELLNLNPTELRVHMRHREQVRQLMTVGCLLLGVLVLGGGILALRIARHQRLAQRLDQVMAEVAPTAKQVQEQSRSSKLIASVLEDRRRLARILSAVFQRTPEAVTLEALVYERGKRELVLRGRAPSTQTVLDYVQQLQQLDDVSQVRLKYSTRRQTPTGERTDFELLVTQAERPT